MSARDALEQYRSFDIEGHVRSSTAAGIEAVLARERIDARDFALLLSDAAVPYLETMARKAAAVTRKHFGNAVFIFTPLYIANYCENRCAYCSFARQQPIVRKKLSLEQIETEARAIAGTGIRHVLLLTGESRTAAPVSYIVDAVEILKRHFCSIAIEVYPLHEEEYRHAVGAGAD
jgi:2-iminoacetate synthase